jgi:hypothetical protein
MHAGINCDMGSLVRDQGLAAPMNYETKVIDLSGQPDVTVTEIEIDRPDRRRRACPAARKKPHSPRAKVRFPL